MQGQGGEVRAPYREFCDWFDGEDPARIHRKAQQAEAFFRTIGITFNVYGADGGDERLIPFDVVPRIIAAAEWRRLERGIEQQVRALTAFLHYMNDSTKTWLAGSVQTDPVARTAAFLPMIMGLDPPVGHNTTK